MLVLSTDSTGENDAIGGEHAGIIILTIKLPAT